MIRKLVLGLGATVALAAAALAPTSASAWHSHHHWHGGGYGLGYGIGLYAPTYVGGSDCYYIKKTVMTYNGPRLRRILVCN